MSKPIPIYKMAIVQPPDNDNIATMSLTIGCGECDGMMKLDDAFKGSHDIAVVVMKCEKCGTTKPLHIVL